MCKVAVGVVAARSGGAESSPTHKSRGVRERTYLSSISFSHSVGRPPALGPEANLPMQRRSPGTTSDGLISRNGEA